MTDIIDKAWDTLGKLCDGKMSWTMHVPVDDRDPDVVFTNLIKHAESAEREVERLRGEAGRAIELAEAVLKRRAVAMVVASQGEHPPALALLADAEDRLEAATKAYLQAKLSASTTESKEGR